MKLTAAETAQLNALCKKFRIDVLTVLHEKQTGHPGGSLSVCEILTTLYFKEMNVRPDEPQWAERDRLVLSKGHPAPMLYRVLAEKGFFPVEEMHTLRDFETRLQGHPCARETPGVDASTGPLGIGLSAAVGMAVGLRMNGSDARVYAILGDGEIEEGTIWEACMSANKFKVDNLCAVLDWNGVQLDGTNDEIMPSSAPSAGIRSRSTVTTSKRFMTHLSRQKPSRVSPPSSWRIPSRVRAFPSWKARAAGTARQLTMRASRRR